MRNFYQRCRAEGGVTAAETALVEEFNACVHPVWLGDTFVPNGRLSQWLAQLGVRTGATLLAEPPACVVRYIDELMRRLCGKAPKEVIRCPAHDVMDPLANPCCREVNAAQRGKATCWDALAGGAVFISSTAAVAYATAVARLLRISLACRLDAGGWVVYERAGTGGRPEWIFLDVAVEGNGYALVSRSWGEATHGQREVIVAARETIPADVTVNPRKPLWRMAYGSALAIGAGALGMVRDVMGVVNETTHWKFAQPHWGAILPTLCDDLQFEVSKWYARACELGLTCVTFGIEQRLVGPSADSHGWDMIEGVASGLRPLRLLASRGCERAGSTSGWHSWCAFPGGIIALADPGWADFVCHDPQIHSALATLGVECSAGSTLSASLQVFTGHARQAGNIKDSTALAEWLRDVRHEMAYGHASAGNARTRLMTRCGWLGEPPGKPSLCLGPTAALLAHESKTQTRDEVLSGAALVVDPYFVAFMCHQTGAQGLEQVRSAVSSSPLRATLDVERSYELYAQDPSTYKTRHAQIVGEARMYIGMAFHCLGYGVAHGLQKLGGPVLGLAIDVLCGAPRNRPIYAAASGPIAVADGEAHQGLVAMAPKNRRFWLDAAAHHAAVAAVNGASDMSQFVERVRWTAEALVQQEHFALAPSTDARTVATNDVVDHQWNVTCRTDLLPTLAVARTVTLMAQTSTGKNFYLPNALRMVANERVVVVVTTRALRDEAVRYTRLKRGTPGNENDSVVVCTYGYAACRLRETPIWARDRIWLLDEFHSSKPSIVAVVGLLSPETRVVYMSATPGPSPALRVRPSAATVTHGFAARKRVKVYSMPGKSVDEAIAWSLPRCTNAGGRLLVIFATVREALSATERCVAAGHDAVAWHAGTQSGMRSAPLRGTIVCATQIAQEGVNVPNVVGVIRSATERYQEGPNVVTGPLTEVAAQQSVGRASRGDVDGFAVLLSKPVKHVPVAFPTAMDLMDLHVVHSRSMGWPTRLRQPGPGEAGGLSGLTPYLYALMDGLPTGWREEELYVASRIVLNAPDLRSLGVNFDEATDPVENEDLAERYADALARVRDWGWAGLRGWISSRPFRLFLADNPFPTAFGHASVSGEGAFLFDHNWAPSKLLATCAADSAAAVARRGAHRQLADEVRHILEVVSGEQKTVLRDAQEAYNAAPPTSRFIRLRELCTAIGSATGYGVWLLQADEPTPRLVHKSRGARYLVTCGASGSDARIAVRETGV